jgi:hypothetical protein
MHTQAAGLELLAIPPSDMSWFPAFSAYCWHKFHSGTWQAVVWSAIGLTLLRCPPLQTDPLSPEMTFPIFIYRNPLTVSSYVTGRNSSPVLLEAVLQFMSSADRLQPTPKTVLQCCCQLLAILPLWSLSWWVGPVCGRWTISVQSGERLLHCVLASHSNFASVNWCPPNTIFDTAQTH